MRSLNTQDVIQIHPAHNFVNIDQFGMYVAPNERPTLWLSFSVFYVWKYEVPHPVKIEEYFWWEWALNYKICYEAISAINWVQTSALILLQSPEIPRGTKWDGRVTVAGVSMRWHVLERFFLRTSGIVNAGYRCTGHIGSVCIGPEIIIVATEMMGSKWPKKALKKHKSSNSGHTIFWHFQGLDWSVVDII